MCQLCRILEKEGFAFARQTGSHRLYLGTISSRHFQFAQNMLSMPVGALFGCLTQSLAFLFPVFFSLAIVFYFCIVANVAK